MRDLLHTPAPLLAPRGSSIAENGLLAELSASFDTARYALQPVALSRSCVLMEPDEEISVVYFPTTCVLSLIAPLGPGAAVEVASVGREGMTGIPEVWLEGRTGARLAVEIPGEAYVMSAKSFRQAIAERGAFKRAALAFSQRSWSMIVQSAACFRHHSVRQQCSRWLLLNSARLGSEHVPVTHDLLADLLGVFRPTVTIALRELQDMGAIEVLRGRVRVLDRAGLEQTACRCSDNLTSLYTGPQPDPDVSAPLSAVASILPSRSF